MGYNIIKYDSTDVRISNDIYFGRDLNKSIDDVNYTVETVKSELYLKDAVGTASNLTTEPYIETTDRIYPPVRYFKTNNLSVDFPPLNINIIGTNILSSAGEAHTIFLSDTGQQNNRLVVSTCGDNLYGQLGLGDNVSRTIPTPITSTVNNFHLNKIVSVVAGDNHTLFLTDTGKVWACGKNSDGQLGLGDNVDRNIPTEITSAIAPLFYPNKIVYIAAGNSHTIFLTDEGKVWVCGKNSEGQLGLGDNTSRNIPTALISPSENFYLNKIVSVACGFSHNVFLTDTGQIWVCGDNSEGQLGLGDNFPRNIPINILTISELFPYYKIISIACGKYHTVLLSDTRVVWTFGKNSNGQLGNNSTTPYIPVAITSAIAPAFYTNKIISIIAGDNHTAFMSDNGKIWMCGNNLYGQLALGNSGIGTDRYTPTELSSNIPQSFYPNQILSIILGNNHTLFTNISGKVWICGNPANGRLGLGSSDLTTNITIPQMLPYFGCFSLYGNGLYNISYSSYTSNFEPFRCFNENSILNNQSTWRSNNYY